jgi:hypothetical protein
MRALMMTNQHQRSITMTITMTIEQYNAISQLKHFAQWYIQEHEGGSGIKEMIEQWESDRDEVQRGLNALAEVDKQNSRG